MLVPKLQREESKGIKYLFPSKLYFIYQSFASFFYLRNIRNCWGSSQNKYSGPVCSYLCSSCDHMHIVDSRFPSTKRCDEAYNILLPSTNRKQAPCPHIIFLQFTAINQLWIKNEFSLKFKKRLYMSKVSKNLPRLSLMYSCQPKFTSPRPHTGSQLFPSQDIEIWNLAKFSIEISQK